MNFQMNNDIKAVLYSKEQIDEVARDLGERITKDFEGKNPLVICVLKGAVLFMADIVRQIDTYCGRTLASLVELLKSRDAASVKICTLLDKLDRRVKTVKPDYVGFEVPNEFVVGYGLDFQGHYRNLPYVGILKPEIYENI